MFHLKTKDKYRKEIYFVKIIFRILISLFFIVFIVNTLYVFNILNISSNQLKRLLKTSMYIMSGLTIVNLIIHELIYKKYKKLLIWEYLDILSKSELPKELPKVVYVYTTHNDFMPSRMLQNMQQSYPNMEYWISDGSSNGDVSKEIKEFAQKHNINLFKMDHPSKNKADNLNTFLTKSSVTFDYLLIGDSDVAFDKNLVQCNIKYFYSKNQIKLGYVSSMMQNYKTKNFFSNMLRFMENLTLFKKDINKPINVNYSSNLYSACCLLKKEYLDDLSNFPEGCFEDGFLELNGSKRYWYGIVSPLTLSVQQFDENIKKYKKRQLRIFDWIIKYNQTEAFKNINNKYISTYNQYFTNVFAGPGVIIGLITLPLLILFLIWFWPHFINTAFYWITILIWLIGGWIITLISNSDSAKIMGKANSVFFPLFQLMVFLSYWPQLVKHWYKAFIKKQYSSFEPSRNTKSKNNKISKFKEIQFDFWMSLISISIITIFGTLFGIFKWHESGNGFNWGMLFLFITLVSIPGMFFLSFSSTIILYLLSFINTNKDYSDDDFVNYPNDYVKHTKIKDDFFAKNKDIERFC